jgi:hypothetical protein
LLELHPGLGTPTNEGRQTHRLTDFPYAVIDRSEGDGIRMLVVRHQNRDAEHREGRR